MPLAEVIFPVLAQRLEPVEVQLVVAFVLDDQFLFRVVGIRGNFFFGRLRLGFFCGRAFGRIFLELEDRILLELLLDPLLQRHDRQLENLHGLDHAGGQNHPLVHPLVHARIESHESILLEAPARPLRRRWSDLDLINHT